jgi:hypothetical protein
MKKSALIGMFFILLMLGSSVSYVLLSAVSTPQNTGDETELPSTNIINYELNSEQEQLLLQSGMVLAKFSYSTGCSVCQQQKSYIESFAKQHSTQILVEEIAGSVIMENSELFVESGKGSYTVTNVTQDRVFDAFCKVMYQPPIDCVLNKV